MSINRAVISGNLTRDPEMRTTASGMPIMSFGVAFNDRRKNNQTGEWEDYANFIDCVMFGNRAQNIQQYLSKGSKVTIEGKLHWSQWERDGQKRSKIEIIVDDIDFGGSKQSSQGSQASYSGSISQPAPNPQQVDNQPSQAPQALQYADSYGVPVQQPPVQYEYSPYDADIPF